MTFASIFLSQGIIDEGSSSAAILSDLASSYSITGHQQSAINELIFKYNALDCRLKETLQCSTSLESDVKVIYLIIFLFSFNR